MRNVCRAASAVREELARCIYKKKEAFLATSPSKSVKSDAFTRLQETYVDTIDVAPSNFSITERCSYSAPDARCRIKSVDDFRIPRHLRIWRRISRAVLRYQNFYMRGRDRA